MTFETADEETPLLHANDCVEPQQKPTVIGKTPLPWGQFSIILSLQVLEPMTSQVISPFTSQLIRDIGVTNGEEARVGIYVGLLQSLFFATEALTTFHWSRLSDLVGRKPILLIGLTGISISMYSFGLSRTFWSVILSRCLCGALNGNVVVMKSMVADITDSTNMPQAYGYIPFAWQAGIALGPLVGGLLAHPTVRYPELFGRFELLKAYPYFLPCGVIGTLALVWWCVMFLFLSESTQPSTSFARLLGLRESERSALRTMPSDSDLRSKMKPLPFRDLLVTRVVIATCAYAAVALIEISFRAVQPVFYATPIEMGGLGLDTPAIGIILAVLGILNGVLQALFFVRLHDWLGGRNLYLFSVFSYFPMLALFPAISFTAKAQGLSYFAYLLVGLQLLAFVISYSAYGVVFMYINASAPNRASIGATNGLAQTVVSVIRAIGPALVNSAYSLSIEKQLLVGNMAYWLMAGMVCIAIGVGSALPMRLWCV
ncbi:major facilitator superfamily domain-containing protein [Suillus subalutaceus]|uniref:major facilitator superfamily domain-containing protein n=1 Tax=Suillus subalutaceus TaxID=48586 RepID=UPI001B873537|nr:major facilitator superfamily domain-containing protein [Suillus subalutaceus]KAG1829525.1 major facilitator superfamily domain-containing protein [Suillus subalutaceus]